MELSGAAFARAGPHSGQEHEVVDGSRIPNPRRSGRQRLENDRGPLLSTIARFLCPWHPTGLHPWLYAGTRYAG